MAGNGSGTAVLIGERVAGEDGRPLGRVIAVIHRDGGADVLVERRRLLRRRTTRLDIRALVRDGGTLTVREVPEPALRQVAAGGDTPGRSVP